MDTQPGNSTGPPDDLSPADGTVEDPVDSSTDTPANDSSPPPPSPSNNPPDNPQDDAPPPPQPQDQPPSSQEPPQNSPPHPPPPSSTSSRSPPPPPPPLQSISPPDGHLSPILILSPPGTSLVPPGVPSAASVSNTESGKSQSNGGGAISDSEIIAIGLVSGYLLLGVIGLAVWWLCLRKKKVTAEVGPGMPTSSDSPQSDSLLRKTRSSPANDSSGSHRESNNLYSYEELVRATSEFSESNLLGEGGFGSVFKGRLPDGREVAVKQLKDGGGQGEREFRAEVETISRIHHRHLVSLVGYCIFDDTRLLVYDYVPNNTLHFHLHGPGKTVLDWSTRIKIATGAARGIAYLHEDCHPRIVHRDIKSSNILLHNNFEAQVSDFGLARLFSDLHTHVTTRVMGTFGYMAPEYASSGILTDKSDVFSFGVVLLELITGRKPVDTSQPFGEESLVEWARPLLNHALEKEEFEKLVDQRLEKNYVASEMFRVIEAAAACVRYSALNRPKMSRILRAFDDMSLSDDTNGMKVDETEICNSARKSAEIRLFRRMAFDSQDYSTTDFLMLSDLASEEK